MITKQLQILVPAIGERNNNDNTNNRDRRLQELKHSPNLGIRSRPSEGDVMTSQQTQRY